MAVDRNIREFGELFYGNISFICLLRFITNGRNTLEQNAEPKGMDHD